MNRVFAPARPATQAGEIDSMESIPGLLKSFKIRAPGLSSCCLGLWRSMRDNLFRCSPFTCTVIHLQFSVIESSGPHEKSTVPTSKLSWIHIRSIWGTHHRIFAWMRKSMIFHRFFWCGFCIYWSSGVKWTFCDEDLAKGCVAKPEPRAGSCLFTYLRLEENL